MMRRFLRLPVWVLLSAAVINQARRDFMEAQEMGEYDLVLVELANSLVEEPRGRLRGWLYRRLTGWIEREHDAIMQLMDAGVRTIFY